MHIAENDAEINVQNEAVFPVGDEVSEEEDINTEEPHFQPEDGIDGFDDLSQHEAYLTLFHYAVDVCNLASQSAETARQALSNLREIRNNMLVRFESSADGEAAIVARLPMAPARVRDRPKKCQIASRLERARAARSAKCLICDGEHDIKHCQHFEQVAAIREENSLSRHPGRKCRISLGTEHNRKGCPFFQGTNQRN
jgi:hypothetical protein